MSREVSKYIICPMAYSQLVQAGIKPIKQKEKANGMGAVNESALVGSRSPPQFKPTALYCYVVLIATTSRSAITIPAASRVIRI